jgi:Uma2 family endonuclease
VTVMTTRAQRALEDLEVPEGFRAELINGEIILSPSSKPLHWRIQRSLIHQFAPLGWEAATDQTIVHPDHGDQPQPDFIALSELEIDPEDFYPADQVLFVAEVLSKSNKGTDLVDKVEVYARFGIPMYLIIDPFKGECLLHTGPHGETYGARRITVFGEAIELPQPIGMTLDTGGFRTYKRA